MPAHVCGISVAGDSALRLGSLAGRSALRCVLWRRSGTIGRSGVESPGHTCVGWMHDCRSVKMLWWDQWKQFALGLCIEMLVDKISAAKTEMLSTREQARFFTANIKHFWKIGRSFGLSPEIHWETRFQPLLASTDYASRFCSLLGSCRWLRMRHFEG